MYYRGLANAYIYIGLDFLACMFLEYSFDEERRLGLDFSMMRGHMDKDPGVGVE